MNAQRNWIVAILSILDYGVVFQVTSTLPFDGGIKHCIFLKVFEFSFLITTVRACACAHACVHVCFCACLHVCLCEFACLPV